MSIQQSDVVYTAVATAENGRDGRVSTSDGQLDVVVNPPKAMGGSGAAPTPRRSSPPVTAPASRVRSASSPATRTPTSPAPP